MYALIEIAGKQYKIEDGVSIKVPKLKGKVGEKYSVDKILYLEDGAKKIIGSPFVKDKIIDGEIVSHGRGRKVVVFKFKRRKGYQKKNTHRIEYTILKFNKLGSPAKKRATKKSSEPTKKKTTIKKDTTKKTPTKKKKATDNINKEEK